MLPLVSKDCYLKQFANSPESQFLSKKYDLGDEVLNRHSFYINLTDYFSPLFNIEESNLVKLSGASYLYFKALIHFDKIADNDENEGSLPDLIVIFQESIRILSGLFPDKEFWENLYNSFRVFVETNKLEKTLLIEPEINESLFIKIAKNKSIMTHAMVDALTILGKNKKHEVQLKSLLAHIHIAFQIRDDIDDFKKDKDNKQFTLAIFKVENYIKKNGLNYVSTNDLYKVLYGSGISVSLIELAIEHYQVANSIVKDLNLIELETFIENEIEDCKCQIKEINLIKRKSIDCNKRSNEPLFNKITLSEKAILTSLKSTLLLFDKEQKSNGWNDFITSAGISTGWATFFICLNLFEADEIEIVKDYLADNKKNIYAYNESLIQDCDSLSFRINADLKLSKNTDKQLLALWKSYEHNGQWSTYKYDEKLVKYLKLENENDIKGWTSKHDCVSSYAAFVLSENNIDKSLLNKTINSLVNKFKVEHGLLSYWWTSSLYSLYFFLRALMNIKYEIGFIQNIIEDKIIQQQNKDGSWKDEFNQKSVFYTAMITHLLILNDFNKYEEYISNGISFLLKSQKRDGSYETIPILKIPAPDISELKRIKHWRKGSLGTNTIVDDHKRLFTSSMVYKTMKCYYIQLWG